MVVFLWGVVVSRSRSMSDQVESQSACTIEKRKAFSSKRSLQPALSADHPKNGNNGAQPIDQRLKVVGRKPTQSSQDAPPRNRRGRQRSERKSIKFNVTNHPAATRDCPFQNPRLRRAGALDCYPPAGGEFGSRSKASPQIAICV